MSDYSYVFNAHPSYIESLYQQYKNDPSSVEEGWRTFFSGFDFKMQNAPSSNGAGVAIDTDSSVHKEFAVMSLIHGYRDRGHLLSDTNPIKKRKDRKPHLTLSDYGLSESDLNSHFVAGEEIGLPGGTLAQILDKLTKIYTGTIGFEFAHIEDKEKRMWLREHIEQLPVDADDFNLPMDKKKRIADKLNGATIFEKFLHTKYIGQKRFSLEGGESAIPALDNIITEGVEKGVQEVVIGMAHRGRLNVLSNILGKTYEEIFAEFEGTAMPELAFGDGDVKYHMGFASQQKTLYDKPVELKLMPNPSHLEAVNPVVQGYSRALSDEVYKSNYDQIMPILIHGDAAVAGQGVVYEIAQMSKLEGYYCGGTVHLVINNQIGFTTNFDDARSSTYCTAAGEMIQAPVFHVNGDDPEAVVFVSNLATMYRQKFNSDVFIDMVCYRKHGHNEGDDPRFTQPEMYDIIKNHKNPRELYLEKLEKRGEVEKNIASNMEDAFWADLQNRLDAVKEKPLKYVTTPLEKAWEKLIRTSDYEDFVTSPETGVDRKKIDHILTKITTIPDGFDPIPKVNRLYKGMKSNLENNTLDWAIGELLAYGTLLMDNHNIRMSGQDVRRGTFSHRHAIIYDQKTFEEYNRLSNLSEDQGRFMIYNSLLSEFGVLGFEYGYSLASPDSLVLWEAQFGDFANGAQVMMDQFISAGESKWGRMSGLVMLLPHGYEGQGPEHSSARLERYLQLCAEFNMTIANCTSPANFYHLIRRQLERPFRKPLVHFSPKSLLRHPLCVSPVEDFTSGTRFQELIDDSFVAKPKDVKRVLFCTGKVYYDLLERQQKDNRTDVAIVRLEQIYPFPLEQMNTVMEKYSEAEYYWVQEEPSNMGAWQYFWAFYRNVDIQLISRKSASSPATGYKKVHDQEQQDIVDSAFG